MITLRRSKLTAGVRKRRRQAQLITRAGFITVMVTFTVFLLGCPSANDDSNSESPLPSVQIFETTGDQSKLLEQQPSLTFVGGTVSSGNVINVDPSKRYQVIDGFGASLSDSSAWLIWNKLNATQQISLMNQFFSRQDGIGLSFLRQPMGATDFTVSGNYSYDDLAAGQIDSSLNNFSIAHDNTYILPLLKRALSVNPGIKLMALPWSAPAWMKNTATMNGGSVDPQYYSSLAQYFVKFVQAYKEAGLPIYAVAVQNEPLYSTSAYPTTDLPPEEEARFIADFLAPALTRASLSDVKILGYEHNWDNISYAKSLLSGRAAPFLAGNSFHCYAGDSSAQTAVKEDAPDKDIWFTECSGITSSHFADDLVWNAEHLLIGATRNWARSVSLWNLALDQNSGPRNGGCANCRGIVTIDDSVLPARVNLNVEYYILGHVSKFVAPGAHRIDSNTFGPGLVEDVAFQNPDGSVVVVVLNSGSSQNSFTVQFEKNTLTYSLPGGALATFLWK